MKSNARLSVVAAAAGLALAAVAVAPSAALADAPPVSTSPTVSVTIPAVAAGTDHSDLKVDLRTVPSGSRIWVEIRCDGYDPYLLDETTPSGPGLTTYVFEAWPEITGRACTLHGVAASASQAVEFSPGTSVVYEAGVPVTHVDGLVIVRSKLGGL